MFISLRDPPSRHLSLFFFPLPPPPTSTLFPYTTLFRSRQVNRAVGPVERSKTSQTKAAPQVKGPVGSEEHAAVVQGHSDLLGGLLLDKKQALVGEGLRP